MEKFYFFIKTSKWLRMLPLSMFLISIVLYSCFKLKSIDHPTTALTESSFDVTFVCEPNTDSKTEGKGYFGALLPVGWEPQTVTDFTVLYPEGVDDIHGQLFYDKDYTDKLKANFTTPEGYYWWGGRSYDDLEIIKRFNKDQPDEYDVKCLNFSFTFRIFTDKQIGDFNLRYLIGTNAWQDDPIKPNNGLYVDVERSIKITENPNPPIDIIEIQQPANQQTYSSTDVDISYIPLKMDNNNTRVFFGALLPKGWRVEDYTGCIVKNDEDIQTGTGRFSYDQYYSDHLENKYTSPEGYYWWGGRTIDDLLINPANNNLSFTFRIYNDYQVGDFNLRYIISGGTDKAITDYLKEETYYPISISQGNQVPIKKDPDWELLSNRGWSENVNFYSDKDYDGFFTRWYGWNGGDIGISSLLNDGRSIWVWGDSHTGIVLSDRQRITDQAQFERNFIILQDGEDFSAFKLINEGTPGNIKESVIPTDDEGNEFDKHDAWYWPNGSVIYYRNGVPELHMVLSRMKKKGEGMWGMTGEAADVAVFSLPDLKLKNIAKFKHKMIDIDVPRKDGDKEWTVTYGIGYAGQVFRDDDGSVYVYGTAKIDDYCGTATVVARVKNGDLTGEWEFYNAETKQWSTDTAWQNDLNNWPKAGVQYIYKDGDQEKSKPIDRISFVFKDAGKYYAFGIGNCFGRELFIYDADTPYGPYRNERMVGKLPDEIADGYVPSLPGIHQQFSKNGELLFSISKNYDNDARKEQGLEELQWYNVPGCADEYRPYFFRMENWRDKLSISDLDATDNKGILTAQYEEDNVWKITDNDEKTIYSTSSGTAWIKYESLTPVNLRRYTITSAGDAPEKDPLHWKLLASNDGENWTVIDEHYYVEFKERSQTISYIVPIDGEFTHFRLDVLASNGGSGLQIAEWQLFGKFEYDKDNTAELESVIVNDQQLSQIEDVIFIDVLSSDPTEYILDFKAKNYGTLKNDEGLFTIIEERPGIYAYQLKAALEVPGLTIYNLTVISEDEKSEKDYKLVFSRRYPFEDLIKVKWNNTLMLYLNKLEDYEVTSYQWYKDNSPVSGETKAVYSAGSKKDNLLDQNASYHIVMNTADGALRTESKQITLKNMGVQAYPNPVKLNETVTIEANIEEELLDGAIIEIYNISGNKVNTLKVQGHATTVKMPSGAGTYMLKFKAKNDFEKTLKVVVR